MVQVESVKNMKKLILSDMVKSVDRGLVGVVWYKLVGDDIDWCKWVVGSNVRVMDVRVKSFRGVVELMPTWLTHYEIVGTNLDITSIRDAQHVQVVREDGDGCVRPTEWKETFSEVDGLVVSG